MERCYPRRAGGREVGVGGSGREAEGEPRPEVGAPK